MIMEGKDAATIIASMESKESGGGSSNPFKS